MTARQFATFSIYSSGTALIASATVVYFFLSSGYTQSMLEHTGARHASIQLLTSGPFHCGIMNQSVILMPDSRYDVCHERAGLHSLESTATKTSARSRIQHASSLS
jgi:hypothetical protein